MKKMIAIVLTIVCMTALCATAFAEYYSLTVQTVNTTDLTYSPSNKNVECTITGKMYVNHTVSGGSSSYTNMIHAVNSYHVLVGQKWATPGLKVPIQSNLLYSGDSYGVAARGNTKHYENDGVTSITLGITYTGN